MEIRRNGKSTRIVDKMVQDFFTIRIAKSYDTNELCSRYNMQMFINRMNLEHRGWKEHATIKDKVVYNTSLVDKVREVSNNYKTAPTTTQELYRIWDLIQDIGLIPIDSSKNIENKSILVIDINYLPSELKQGSYVEVSKILESMYGYKVLLIDGSRQNIQGAENKNKPAYFI